jgi:dienelactone hydrolase
MKKYFLLALALSTQVAFADCDGHTETFTISDPKDGLPFEVTAKVYRPRAKKFPVIFVLPPIVGETPLDRRVAKKFCQNNMGSYILNVVRAIPQEEELSNLLIHDDSYVRALRGLRVVREKLETDPSVTGEFGIMGMSLGGMLAAYVSGVEADFKATVIVVGAGNVPAVLANSDQEIVKAQREARQKYFNLKTQAEYQQLLRNTLTEDPLNVIQNITPGTSYFFIAKKDTTVPTRNQIELKDKAPSPLVFEMNGDHLSGLVKGGTIHAGKITNFFRSKFKR